MYAITVSSLRDGALMSRSEKCPKATTPIRLVEHNPIAARYLMHLLRRIRGIEVLSDQDVLARRATLEGLRSILIIDEGSLPTSLAGYLHSARSALAETSILVLGRSVPSEDLCRTLFLGIHGFIPYDALEDQLGSAIQAIRQGHLWVPPGVLEQFARYVSGLRRRNQGSEKLFTPREQLVLGLLQRRLSNKQISSALLISERTVKFHLSNIFSKMGVHDRYSVTELVKSGRIIGKLAT